MFHDARSVPEGTVIETEVCIVGGGAAGITMAREFIGAGFRTALLESGSTEIDSETQDLYAGDDIGRPFLDLTTCRLRFFGGTTNHWGGWCRPLEPLDFEIRDGIPHSGWPFDRAHLDPWYRRAHEVCELGPLEYSPSSWGIAPGRTPDPFKGPHFIMKVLQQSPPTRFGPVYAPALRQAERVSVYLNANALRFDSDASGREVRELQVGTLSGRRFSIRARAYVLAAGGIENARLLLLSGPADGNGLGNERDLVGRYFMVHLVYSGGEIALSDPYADMNFITGRDGRPYDKFRPPERGFVSFVGLSPETMRERALPGITIMWAYKFAPTVRAVNALKRLLGGKDAAWADVVSVFRDLDGLAGFAVRKALFDQGIAVDALAVGCSSEPLPNPESRVLLGTDRDALGLRKVAVDWHWTAEDKRKTAAIHRLLGAELGRAGFGRLRTSLSDDDETWPEDMYGDAHHIGTTRMHRDPARGVVDENCRVHGVANLYVAGSSVFPTSGSANPTLTITALALRLADHIKERLA